LETSSISIIEGWHREWHRSLCPSFQNIGFKFDHDAADRQRGLLTTVLYSWTWYFCIFNSKSSKKVNYWVCVSVFC
jgi:hypothetical protein